MSGVKASMEGQVNSPERINPKNAKQKAAQSISVSKVTGCRDHLFLASTSSLTTHTTEEKKVVQHFSDTHVYSAAGRYRMALPRRTDVPSLKESHKQALQRYEANEISVLRKGNWAAFQEVVQEYLDLSHAEPVPKPTSHLPTEMYYMPMHSVVKASSTSV